MYSLRANSWRRKNRLVLGTVVVNSFSKVFISFDIRSEVIQYIKIPYKIDMATEELWPFVRNGSLAVVIRSKTTEYRYTFSIWVMTEYGVKESWKLDQTINCWTSMCCKIGGMWHE